MALHYELLNRTKTRVEALGLVDRDSTTIPSSRIKAIKSDAKQNWRQELEVDGESFPGILIFHDDSGEKWDIRESTNLMNMYWFPVHIVIVDTDRGDSGASGQPDVTDEHDARLSWRQSIFQEFISQQTDGNISPPICHTRQVREKLFSLPRWLDGSGLWYSKVSLEFGVYLPKTSVTVSRPITTWLGDTDGVYLGDI